MTASARLVVSVIGSADCTDEQAAAAEQVGRLLAQAGVILVCGGRGGVMEAACRGAEREAGLTVGILPGSDRDGANPYLTVALPTGLGQARNALVVLAADAVIAIGGGHGTLSEIALACKLGKPVIGLASWAAGVPGGTRLTIEAASSPEQAVQLALTQAQSRLGLLGE